MTRRVFILAATLVVTSLLNGCDSPGKLTTTKIKDIVDHPRDYENMEVTISGTVTSSASLFVVKFFEIQDDSGAIKVVTERVLPKQGDALQVTGVMQAIEIGAERLIVLREKSN